MSGASASRKGKKFERFIVNKFNEYRGINAERMYGSDGTHVGLSKNVDIVLEVDDDQYALQCKHLKEIPKYLQIFEGTDGSIIKQNLKEPVVIMKLDSFCNIISRKG